MTTTLITNSLITVAQTKDGYCALNIKFREIKLNKVYRQDGKHVTTPIYGVNQFSKIIE